MNKIGRPKGFKVSEESKKKASNTMKNYYENMTPKQKQIRDNCNKMKSEVYHKAMELYYQAQENNS